MAGGQGLSLTHGCATPWLSDASAPVHCPRRNRFCLLSVLGPPFFGSDVATPQEMLHIETIDRTTVRVYIQKLPRSGQGP